MKCDQAYLEFVLTNSPRVLLPKPIMMLADMAGDGTGARTARRSTILDIDVFRNCHAP